jgi:Adenylate and Guanylate cyclase catalytic domain/zinc-ribbon domain
VYRSEADYPLRVRDNPGMAGCDRCGAEIPRDARFCPSCGAPVSAERPTEERKLATVLFADLVGSTALAGSQDPERTRVLLDRFYEAMAEEIERAGGTTEKFAGDAVMAAFGAPSALEDHAERALHAALAMQRRLGELFEGQVALRIGVNTGDVVVGRARAGSSFVSGDAVNVAARLEQAAAPGAILSVNGPPLRRVALSNSTNRRHDVSCVRSHSCGRGESVAWRRRLSVAIMSWSASSMLTGRLRSSDDPGL